MDYAAWYLSQPRYAAAQYQAAVAVTACTMILDCPLVDTSAEHKLVHFLDAEMDASADSEQHAHRSARALAGSRREAAGS